MRLARPGGLAGLLPLYSQSALSYDPVGATQAELPPGFAHTRRHVRLGDGGNTFEKASESLASWQMHRRAGLRVAADGSVAVGRTVVLGLGVGLVLVIPCRVVYVIDEPRRRGFAYGTLPDHPEQGEEAFVVSQDATGSVWLDITVYSRPGTAVVRWAGPIARAIQTAATTRYENSLRALAS
jgi:uncharacterized protein (UPF0548 family)